MKITRCLAIYAITLMASNNLLANELMFGNSINGEKMHNKHCLGCHNTDVYTRKNRKINSYANLQHRVNMCASQLNISINTSEQQDIAKFLAEHYYKF